MNNEQIIIDGVDVAGCEFFEPKAQVMQCHMRAITQRCKDNNCYYKQLQRLQVENEQLKVENEQLTEDLTALQQTYKACENEYRKVINQINERVIK